MAWSATVKEIATPVGVARAHVLARPAGLTLVLGHGAGGGIEAADLDLVARLAGESGLGAVLVEQPWRVAGRRVAVAPAQLDQAWLAIVPALRLRGRIVVGGRSAGARVAARTAVPLRRSGVDIAGALLLAFPLHPPGRPVDRSEELGLLRNRVRTVIVQGTRDPFGTASDLRPLTAATVIEANHADHSLRPAGRNGPAVVEALERAIRLVSRFRE